MTLVEIMIVVIIMALIATGVAVAVMPQLERSKVNNTRTAVVTVRSAAEMYLANNPGSGCPSIDDLVNERFLNASSSTVDDWGNDFSVDCAGTDVTVTSAGPDGQMGSEDDISTGS
jgi:general secretion pathway protein G